MNKFLSKYHDRVTAVLSGFDRLLFRGTLRQLAHVDGLSSYLAHKRVLLKNFKSFAESLTERIKSAVQQWAESLHRRVIYVQSSRAVKEDLARSYREANGIDEGLICVLSCVEPCQSFQVRSSREQKLIELRSIERKCLHYYAYFIDSDFGLMHIRLQTWLPFTARICINGREWLARQMDKLGLRYRQADNCFQWLEQPKRAQELSDSLLQTDWPTKLNDLLFQFHQAHVEMFRGDDMDYYWSVHQSEWATDVLFDAPDSLAQIYPQFIQHAMLHFQSPDVLRFLGKRFSSHFKGEVTSGYKDRTEGVRIKHHVKTNSIKMYDKQESVLRVEATVNDPRDFKAYRTPEGKPNATKRWLSVRKGVADVYRLTRICQSANERYLDALAAVETGERLSELVKPLTRPTTLNGRRVRPLQPFGKDADLLQAINRGEFLLHGFRNRDLVRILYPQARGPDELRRVRGRVTRLLRLLRAHHLVKKVPRTHRYHLSDRGRTAIAAVLAANAASVKQLLAAA